MKNSTLPLYVLFAVFIASLTVTEPAAAQQRRGRGGNRGPISRLRLTSIEKVQAELKLTEEQTKAAGEINAKLNADRTKMFQTLRDGGGDRASMGEKLAKLNSSATEKLLGRLDDGQKKRLTELFVQVNGMNSLSDKEVAKSLNITDKQKDELTEVQAPGTRTESWPA